MSDTYSEAKKRIERALDEMRALESAPVIADFAPQYDVPYDRLCRRFHGTPSKFDLVSGYCTFSDVEEKAICRYLDPLDRLGLPYKHYHTKALDVAVRDGHTRFNQVEFLSAIGETRRQTFKESTIKSAFRT
jgi:hypothetical protein